VEIHPVAKCLNGRDDSRHQLAPRDNFKITGEGAEGRTAELSLQPAVVAEEDAEHPGDGEDKLAVGHIEEEFLSRRSTMRMETAGNMAGQLAEGDE